MTTLLVNLLAKMDLVSKNVSKRGKRAILGGVL